MTDDGRGAAPKDDDLLLFDADQWQDSKKKPALRIGGKTYTGRPLSFEAMGPLAKRFLEGFGGALDEQGKLIPGAMDIDVGALNTLVQDVCSEMDLPGDQLVKLPVDGVLAAMQRFFSESLGGLGAFGSLQVVTTDPPGDGKDSRPPGKASTSPGPVATPPER